MDLIDVAKHIANELELGASERTILLNPFLRCVCGKIHVVRGDHSFCTCGRDLYEQTWRR